MKFLEELEQNDVDRAQQLQIYVTCKGFDVGVVVVRRVGRCNDGCFGIDELRCDWSALWLTHERET